MFKRTILATAIAASLLFGHSAMAASGVNIGALNCRVAGGIGFIFGSSKTLTCTLNRTNGAIETYTGEIKKYGLDLGFTTESHIIWAVFAPGNIAAGSLAGQYGGVSADVALGLGLGANVLVGGNGNQIALQPLSINGDVGVNIAAGITTIVLRSGS
jgi:hypothetical protein